MGRGQSAMRHLSALQVARPEGGRHIMIMDRGMGRAVATGIRTSSCRVGADRSDRRSTTVSIKER